MINFKQIFITLVLLLTAVSGAWAQEKYLYFEVSQDGTSATMKCSDSPGDNPFYNASNADWYQGSGIWSGKSAITTVTVDASCVDFAGTSLRGLFHNFWGLTTIEGLTNLNTANVTNMDDMFYLCENLQTLDLSGFNTAKVTSMSKMFNGCRELTSLDLSSFNTANVEYMYNMFEQSGLTSINFSGWNTAKVGNMSGMFKDCKALTTLDLTSWDTGKVVYMDMMFNHCDIIETIYVSDGWSTASVSSGDAMFGGCEKLYEFNYKEVDQSKAIPIEQGGYLNYKAPGIDLVSKDGKTWSFADGKMPAGNVTLNVEYYTPAGLAWKQGGTDVPETGVTACDGFPFVLPTLDNPNNLTGITYESSNTDVATVDADGKVTIVDNANGSTTITAKYPGNDTYEDKTVSYTLTVTAPITLTLANSDPEKGTVTVEGASGGGAEGELLVTMKPEVDIIYDPETATDVAEVTTTNVRMESMGRYMWMYSSSNPENKGILEVKAQEGYTITKVVFFGVDEDGASHSHEVTASPFAVYPWTSQTGADVHKTDSYNTPIDGIHGITKIEVYGYEGSAASSVKPTEKEGEYIVIPNSEITLKATANDGYHVASWSNGAEVNDILEATQTLAITEALNITANFAANPIITLASSDPEKGTVSLASAGEGIEPFIQLTVPDSWSSEVQVPITADDLPGFVASTEEAVKAMPVPSEGNVFVIYGFTEDGKTKAVTFENGEYVRTTSSAVDHGSTSTYSKQGMIYCYTGIPGVKDLGDGQYSVLPGTELKLTATANEGYYVKGWKVGQTDVTEGVTNDDYYDAEAKRMPATSTITLTLAAAAEIKAVFDEMSYIISPFGGTDDAANWKGAIGTATATQFPLEGVKKGETVNVTYTGQKKVLDLTATVKAAEPADIEVTWNVATKSGSFTSTAGDVTLTPVYAPVAAFDLREGSDDKLPEAVSGIYAGTTDAIVTAGACTQGTLMYYAAQSATGMPTAPTYATEGWTATLPTAANFTAGNVYVWYYIKGADAPEGQAPTAENTFSDSEISAEPLTISISGYKIEVPAGEYVTYYRDKALKATDEDAELYTISSVTDTEAVLSDKIDVAPAETPLLVYNKSQETKVFILIPTTDEADEVSVAKEFVGTLEASTIEASTEGNDNYALNGKAFVWVKNALSIAANKCWLNIVQQQAKARAASRSIVNGNGTTGIDAVDSLQPTDDSYYDLQGRKVEKPNRKGIYIHNGQKVVVRN